MKISELPELASLPADGYVPIVSNGTTYRISASFFGGAGGTPPPAANTFDDDFSGSTLSTDWLWSNQKTATAVLSNGFLDFQRPSAGSGDDISSLYKVPPTAPFTVTAKIAALGSGTINTSQGLIIGDNTGKLIYFNSYSNGNAQQLAIFRFNSFAQFNSAPYAVNANVEGGLLNSPYFVRVSVSATDIKFRASAAEGDLMFESALRMTEKLPSFLSSVDRVGFNLDPRQGNSSLSVDWIKFT